MRWTDTFGVSGQPVVLLGLRVYSGRLKPQIENPATHCRERLGTKRMRITRADSLSENLTTDINGSWAYNTEGKLNGVTYPVDPNYRDWQGNPITPASYSHSFDGMGRLAGMTETAPQTFTLVSGVAYNAAGQPLTGLDTRTYNANGQLTHLVNGSMNITCNLLSDVDRNFSHNSQGRLTTATYSVPAISHTFDNNENEIDFTGDTVVEMYSYSVPGQVTAKRLRITRADSLSENLTTDINGSWSYNNEGKLNGVTYPVDPNYRDPVSGNPITPFSFSYSFDGMGRLAGMTETAPQTFTLGSDVT